jgi:hypothetical protein
VAAIGLGFSSLGPLALQTARQHPELGITVVDDAWPDERFFFRSDHFNFARKEIPAIFFFSGTHEDYHRPSDHADRIDTEKTARIARLLFHLGHAIATNPQPPEWSEEGLRQVRALTGSRNSRRGRLSAHPRRTKRPCLASAPFSCSPPWCVRCSYRCCSGMPWRRTVRRP